MALRTVTRQHHGDRIVASAVPTRDHRIFAPTRISSDSMLEATSTRGLLDSGVVWSGDLEGRAQRALAEAQALRTPISDPRIDSNTRLDAEGPGNVLNLGDVYDGLSRAARGDQEGGIAQIERAVADAKRRKATGESADWGARAVARGRLAQEDACAQMRAAADKLWGTGGTTDTAAPAASGKRLTNEELNRVHADFWANR